MLKYINKFKSDFGGQVVSIERVQPSLDHVHHRSVTSFYLLILSLSPSLHLSIYLSHSLTQVTIFALTERGSQEPNNCDW
jgi:hypothetical protein